MKSGKYKLSYIYPHPDSGIQFNILIDTTTFNYYIDTTVRADYITQYTHQYYCNYSFDKAAV
jgi:hypothetical protein